MMRRRGFVPNHYFYFIEILIMVLFVSQIYIFLTLRSIKKIGLNIINTFGSSIDDIKLKIDDLYEISLGDYPYNISLSTICSILFTTYNNINGSAYGVIIVVNNEEYFVVTNRHVVYHNNTTRIIREIMSFDGTVLTPNPPFLIFSKKDAPDLCLIPLKINKSTTIKAAKISRKKCPKSTPFFNAIFKNSTTFYSKCNIVEDTIKNPNNFDLETDCGGMPGYSGSGYFNYKGELCAIHKGQGKSNFEKGDFQIENDLSFGEQAANYFYEHMSEIYGDSSLNDKYIRNSIAEKYVLIDEIYQSIKYANFSIESLELTKLYFEDLLDKMNDVNSSIYKEFVYYSNSTLQVIFKMALILARNPRTLVVDGSRIYDLISKPSLVLKVYQNSTYLLS